MKKIIVLLLAVIMMGTMPVMAASTCKVLPGDSLWKIASRCKVGLSEILKINKQLKDPNCINTGDIINVPSENTASSSYEQEVVRLVNEIRKNNGLSTLKENWELSRVARYKSQDMKDNKYFSHNSPVYGTPFQMIRSFGISYRTAGENIAMGHGTPKAVVDGWMNSSGHRANILNKSFTQIGVGYVASGNYWTQMFIG